MSSPSLTPREALQAIDARHDELIRKLDDLNSQIEAALAEFASRREISENETPASALQGRQKSRLAA